MQSELAERAKVYARDRVLVRPGKEVFVGEVRDAYLAGARDLKKELVQIGKAISKRLTFRSSEFEKGQLDGVLWMLDFLDEFES